MCLDSDGCWGEWGAYGGESRRARSGNHQAQVEGKAESEQGPLFRGGDVNSRRVKKKEREKRKMKKKEGIRGAD